ncbi:MAG: hypothetical protein KAX84_08490 [Burkholderiales bacterium]|nr:hypothetical protein [Burkholderiales bacterium]
MIGSRRAVISYYDLAADALRVARCANAACTGTAGITTIDDPTNNVGTYTSIALGNDGLPVISYRDETAGSLKVAKCANPSCTGAATITTVDDPINSVGIYTSIAVGNDGRPVISHFDTTSNSLKVAKCANAACTGVASNSVVDNPANEVGTYTSIAIGNDGLPVISYHDETAGALKVAKCANAACTGAATITTVDGSANDVGEYTSIAIGADGLPVISYRDRTANTVNVAHCANPACTGAATITSVAASSDFTGNNTALAIGADGLPVIAHVDNSAERGLSLTRCSTPACTGAAITSMIDGTGTMVAIAIGSDGLPLVAYYDNQVGDLKAAKCGTPGCR